MPQDYPLLADCRHAAICKLPAGLQSQEATAVLLRKYRIVPAKNRCSARFASGLPQESASRFLLSSFSDSTVGWNRTSDQLCIRQPLWPTELRQHNGAADWGWTSNLRLMKAVLYHWATAAKSCWPASNRWPAPYESAALPFELQQHMELPTGLEPATSALQGRLSSHWVTAANKKPVPAGTSTLRLDSQIRLSIHWTDYSRTDPGIRSMRAW